MSRPKSVGRPARQVMTADPNVTTIATDRFEGDWPIERESRTGAAVNPMIAAQVNSPSMTAGCSNIVTPVPHYVPRLFDMQWIIGAVAIIKALLDPDGRIKRKTNMTIELVQQKIDMNDYLPTSYDDMSEWRTAIGPVTQPAR